MDEKDYTKEPEKSGDCEGKKEEKGRRLREGVLYVPEAGEQGGAHDIHARRHESVPQLYAEGL